MALTIDIRYNPETKRWTAKPRFHYDQESAFNGPKSGEGTTPDMAIHDLCRFLPPEMVRPIQVHTPQRIYYSPECDFMHGEKAKCLDVDGHCPSQKEFEMRHFEWMRCQAEGREYKQPTFNNNQNESEMDMEIQGKIIQVLPPQCGMSRDGKEWKLQGYVLETDERYPKKIYFEVFGEERINNNQASVGDKVTVGIDIESREFNAKWFTTIRAWKVDKTA